MKATASAPANIALVKYWGAADLERAVPLAPSLSMTLSLCRSVTTVELLPQASGADRIELADGRGGSGEAPAPFRDGVLRHLRRLRERLGVSGSWRVTTHNSFPASAGLASSASGFAALALAAAHAAGERPDPERLSLLARDSGSGSAARSALGGFVEWPVGGEEGPARQIAPPSHWPLCDVIAVVESRAKEISSRDGHRRATTSPHFRRRLELLPERLAAVRHAVAARDLARLGPLLEEEAIELHLIAMSSRPPIFYWRPATVAVLAEVRRLRDGGLQAWSTMDAGANVHVLCPPEEEPRIAAALAAVPGVEQVLRDRVGEGPELREEHLF